MVSGATLSFQLLSKICFVLIKLYVEWYGPFPHSCKQRRKFEVWGDKIQSFVWNYPRKTLLTEAEYGKGLALFQEQNLEIVVVCLHDQNARRKKKVRDISYDFHYYHVVRISTPHFCDTGKHTVNQIKNVYFPCISVACLLSSKEKGKR